MGRATVYAAIAVLLMAGAAAPAYAGPSCKPEDVDTLVFLDLAGPTGQIACKAGPNTDIGGAIKKLTGIARGLSSSQLEALPGFLTTIIPVSPAQVQPFLSLGSSQLQKVVPVLTQVPTDVLAGTLKQLSQYPDYTLTNMLQLLRSVGLSRLQQLESVFEDITPKQVSQLERALKTLPNHAIDFIIQATRKFGGFGGSNNGGYKAATVYPPNTKDGADKFYRAAEAKAAGSKPCPDDKAAAAGSDILLDNTDDIAKLACQFGTDRLNKVLTSVLTYLAKQHPDTLANLPTFANILSGLDPKTLDLFFQIPQSTLRELIPVLTVLPTNKVDFLLKTLAGESSSTIDSLIWFLKNISYTQVQLMVPLFSRINSCQVANMAKLLRNLSPQQMLGSLGMLDGFQFQLGPIGIRVNIQATWFNTPDHNKCGGSSTDAGEATVARFTKRVGPFTFGSGGTTVGGGTRVGPFILGGGSKTTATTTTFGGSQKGFGGVRIGGGGGFGGGASFGPRFTFGRH